jgi:trehalose utilization protein
MVAAALALAAAALCCLAAPERPRALIVADEIPAMRVVAELLGREAGMDAQVATQAETPDELAAYACVLVYIHGKLDHRAEEACIRFAEGGGKLIVLHHSISSAKRAGANPHWFRFLGVEAPSLPFEQGGYRWIEGVTMDIRALAPKHPILRGVKWEQADGRPGFRLEETEVYLNHVLGQGRLPSGDPCGKRTLLLGLTYTAADGRTYRQETAGWTMPTGKGHVVYLMPGHTDREFRHPAYARILANAARWRP